MIISLGFVKCVQLFLITSICLIVVLYNRSKRTIRNRKRNNTNEHNKRAEHTFKVICSWNVSITNSCDCWYDPVKSYSINIISTFFILFKVLHPCSVVSSIWIINRSYDNPQTWCQVTQNDEDNQKEKQSFKSKTNL